MKNRNVTRILSLGIVTVALAWPSSAFAQDAATNAWKAGLAAFNKGNPRECVTQMRAALKEGGEAYERWGWIHLTLGACLGQSNQRDEAISELQTAKELVTEDSERFQVNHSLAQIYVSRGNSGDYDRAIAAENEASKYAGSGGERAVVAKTLGQSYYFKKDWTSAITHLETAAASRTTDADLAQKLGRAYLETGNDSKAMTWFQKTLSLDRTNAAAVTNMGRLYVDQANWTEAIRYLEQGVRLDSQNMKVRNLLGRAYMGAERYADAIAQLVQVVQSRPSDGNAHYNLAQAYKATGSDAKAIEELNAALAHLAAGSPVRAQALYDIGFVYEKVGNYDDALSAFEDAAAMGDSAKTTEAITRVRERIKRQKSGS